MAGRAPDPGFFVGYLNSVPRSLAIFLVVAAAAMVGGMAGLAFALGSNVNDPGDGAFARKLGKPGDDRRAARRIPIPSCACARTRTIPRRAPSCSPCPASASVKRRGRKLFGQVVDAKRLPLPARRHRHAADPGQGLAQGGGGRRRGACRPQFTPAPAEPLGRWRLIGEICDSKCHLGAMRPGDGLAHKACANLCISSGAPPIFVTADDSAVEGETFLLMADRDGGPLPDNFRDYVAVLVQLEGEVERLDDLLVFKVDIDRTKVF